MRVAATIFLFLLTATNTYAFFWNKTTKVIWCEERFHEYELKDGFIFVSVSTIENGKKARPIAVSKLQDCTIKDASNWSCGGKTEVTSNLRIYTSPSYTVIEDVFNYSPPYPKLNGGCDSWHQVR